MDMDNFFTMTRSEVFKEMPAERLIETNYHTNLSCSKQSFSDKKVFTLAAPKNSLLTSAAIKNKNVKPKRLLYTTMTVTDSIVGVSKLAYAGLIFINSGVNVDTAYHYYLSS